MDAKKPFQNWRLETDKENIAWLYLNRADASTNTLNPTVLNELSQIIDQLNADTTVNGLIIASAKANGFIAGADVEYFGKFDTVEQASEFMQLGQKVFAKLAAMKIPTVAMVKGFCMGGGVELILACRYRVAEDGQKTRFALPEVLLGIHPGWGGTVRLPRLVGALAAMDLMLTGRQISAKEALRIGLVDAVVPERELQRAALYYVTKKPPVHKTSLVQRLSNLPFARQLIGNLLRKKLIKKVNSKHYPAPYALVEKWQLSGVDGEAAFTDEVTSIANLLAHDTAKNLIRVFFLRSRLKSMAKDKEHHFIAKNVHVIGAGAMGGDIAAWCALRGLRVTLQDQNLKAIGASIKRAYELFKKKLKNPRDIRAAMDRLIPDPQGEGIAKADVIIEAIFENLAAKQQVFKEVEAKMKPGTLLATNTSSIPLEEIGKALTHPNELVGMHFFNPVAKMPLVEVVRSAHADLAAVAKANAFVGQLDKLPLPVKSSPGFLVNRVLMPYLLEAMVLVNEGVSPASIDQAAVDFGMPMGPIELADAVGLDICLSVADILTKYYGGLVPNQLREMVAAGHLGRKSGQGFYKYDKKGKPKKDYSGAVLLRSEEIADRLINKMINEAIACLKEKVVVDADLVDAGMIFGTGFAPFRGGPMHYAETIK